MGPMSDWSPAGALELILSNISDIAFGAVDTLHKLMSSLRVMHNIDIDWTTMFLFFWIFFGLLVYSVANILIIVNKKRQQIIDESNSFKDKPIDENSVQQRVSQVLAQNKSTKENFAKGPDKCCVDWVNKIIKWFYSQSNVTIDSLLNIWMNALNSQINRNSKLLNDTGYSIEFIELCRRQSSAPELFDINVDKESNENIKTECKMSIKGIKFLIKAFKDIGSVNEDSFHYELTIDRFEGMLKTICISEDQLLVVKFMERPDFKANLRPVKNPQTQQMRSDKGISEDAIITAIVNRITSTVVDLCLSQYKDFPRLERSDTQNILSKSSSSEGIERKLFVKVVQANGLAQNKGSHDPYCVVEVDDPSQRLQTSAIKDTNNPVWNEHFIFNLKEESSEILFELYDKTNDKFLGLGIVSIDELKRNPSQNQVLKLEPRPLESDPITGSLAVEFLFMEHRSGDNLSDTEIKSVEQNIIKSNGISLKNSNKEDLPLILSTGADEQLIRNDTKFRELEVIEEQNQLHASLAHTSSESNVSSLTKQTQDIGFGQNPFIQIKTNPFIDSSNDFSDELQTNAKNNHKNPFLSHNSVTKNLSLNRSVSCDNLRLVIPIIPPLIDLSVKPHQNSSPNLNHYLLNEDFKGNPFDILKLYRRNFYSVPTHKIGRHFSQSLEVNSTSDHISLPPTTLFPEYNHLNEVSFLRTNSQNNVNTNPFLGVDRHLITSSFSIDSMIGIESCDENSDESSDNTITHINTDLNRKTDPMVENEIKRDKKDLIISNEINYKNKTNFKKNKNSFKKRNKVFSNKISFKQKLNKKTEQNETNIMNGNVTNNSMNNKNNNNINRYNIENSNIGFGTELHEPIINNTSVNQNEIEFCLTPDSSEVNSSKKSLSVVHSNQRSSVNGGSEGYGTGRGTPDNPSINEGSQVSSANSAKEEKSRSRSKESRSLMRAIKKRFSFSKNRSKSAEIRTEYENKDETPSRDSSVSSTSSRAKSMPGSREPSAPKEVSRSLTPIRHAKSKTESYSNISEISGYSTKTFVHEKSTLIIETKENGSELKHYIIPISLANKSKWRRKGLKLHSYNEHLFVAKHLSGSITCQVCGKLFSRRPGKQGYQCRDCNYMCHKRCHIQVEVRCTKSTLSSLKLEYVVDPKATQTDKICSIEVNDKPLTTES